MSKEKPSAPKGMRDFSPVEMRRRNYIFDTIRRVYENYGFLQIETPAMEKLETLTGKYGEEGDRLIFKVLNSGDYLNALKENFSGDTASLESKKTIKYLSEKALRYDLTVPFARYVVQHHHEIAFPFKRYQVQPVWRADNPQKGRYREFYQCDADVIGSKSLMSEIEFVQIYDEVLNRLGLGNYVIKINNRKILAGMAEVINIADQLIPFTIALDKLDKIGREKVLEELRVKWLFPEEKLAKVAAVLDITGSNEERLGFLKNFLASSETGMLGIAEIEEVLSVSESLGRKSGTIEFDMALARGLDYYTGCIFEVKIPDSGMGSISGGGRYDDLTGIFGMPGISGVGISFGADRIYDILLAGDLFPSGAAASIRFLFLNFGSEESLESLRTVQKLRAAGIAAAVYPDAVDIKKQMKYANALQVPFVCSIGSDELGSGNVAVKDMVSGSQAKISIQQFLTEHTR